MRFRWSRYISSAMAVNKQMWRKRETIRWIGTLKFFNIITKKFLHSLTMPMRCENEIILMDTGRTPVCADGSGIWMIVSSRVSRGKGPAGLISLVSQTAMSGQNSFGIGSSERFQKPRQKSISASRVTFYFVNLNFKFFYYYFDDSFRTVLWIH